MNSSKPLQIAAAVLGLSLFLYFTYSHLQYFGNISLLGGILLLEFVVIGLWKYDQRFFAALMIAFVWAGLHVPMQGAWIAGRWLVLSSGAIVGYAVWAKNQLRPFGTLHLMALFCICAAFISATVSLFVQMASFKAISLLLLFLYCASGARVAVIGREKRFFNGLVLGSEIAVYLTAICYFGLGESIWGNPNSLGAVMSIGLFPVLLWGWFTTDQPSVRLRRLGALALSAYLVFFSMARAGIASIVLVILMFCLFLKLYKLLLKIAMMALFSIAIVGMLAPAMLDSKREELTDAVLYKGHKSEGLLGSRMSPWEKSITTIKEHPLFGTGYGTSPTGEDPGSNFGTINSSAETSREHGSSFLTIAEWVGLLGVLPFVGLLSVTASNVWKVCVWMKRSGHPRHYSVPLAMVVLSGLVHASFEDWLFAAGSYLCVYFWVFAFLLADFAPGAVVVPSVTVVSRTPRPSPAGFGAAVSNPFVSNR